MGTRVEGPVLATLEAIAEAKAQRVGRSLFIDGEKLALEVTPANKVVDFIRGRIIGEDRGFGLMPNDIQVSPGEEPSVTFANQVETVTLYTRDGNPDFQRGERTQGIDLKV